MQIILHVAVSHAAAAVKIHAFVTNVQSVMYVLVTVFVHVAKNVNNLTATVLNAIIAH